MLLGLASAVTFGSIYTVISGAGAGEDTADAVAVVQNAAATQSAVSAVNDGNAEVELAEAEASEAEATPDPTPAATTAPVTVHTITRAS